MKDKLQHSEEYLNKKTGGNPGFSVPSNYFDTVESSFSTKQKENNFVKAKGFEIPDSYFKKLEDNILAKVSTTKKETPVISLKKRFSIAAAASIILFIGLNSLIFNNSEEDLFDKLSDSEIESWIANNSNLIHDSDFEITYADIDFDEDLVLANSISNDELENYLSDTENLSLILENY
jgi:hypothetical protein